MTDCTALAGASNEHFRPAAIDRLKDGMQMTMPETNAAPYSRTL